ncbi:hypothetical protein [Sphingomonas adhaesiva]|uniref:hypothetical protein n=1 Tax=Sphingomonas adhaesiva TaxID=28212 RepID=UPI002FF5A5E6
MSPAEQALCDQSPTFADMCDRVRTARRAHLQAIGVLDAAKARVKRLEEELRQRIEDDKDARDALDAYIEREIEVAE